MPSVCHVCASPAARPEERTWEAHIKRVEKERDDALGVLAFAASVIKSGESWSTTCEKVIGGALKGCENG